MSKPPASRRALPLFAFTALASTHTAQALDYGIYDARALAMGGTALAVGNTEQAQYYNPALMAFHTGDEDLTRDSRAYFPTFVLKASNTVEDAANAVDDELDTKLSDAVNRFNTTQTPASAGAIASSASDLRDVLNKIANKDIAADGFIGLSVSEPSDREGGAFYMGARFMAAGTSNVTKADLALLDEYIAATTELANGASQATVAANHPNLVNPNGTLKDPTQTLSSSADVSALAIGEWGVAVGKEFTFWGQKIALGITPKMQRVDAYRDNANFNNSNINNVTDGLNQFSDTKSTHITFNADVGMTASFAEHYRVSLAVKDMAPKDFTTHQGDDPVTGEARPDLVVKLHPRSRLGLGYVNQFVSVGLDYDLKESTPMANEAASQYLSLGAEYRSWETLALRIGYRQDKTGLHANATSAGLGYRWRQFVVELAYASSADMKAGGLQVGWAF